MPHVIVPGSTACSQPVPHELSNVKLMRRIVAGPGDVISIRNGHVIRNGMREPDSYTRICGVSPMCSFPVPIKIPPDHWFVMGDNRGATVDSRYWGPVRTSWIIGHVIYCSVVGMRCLRARVRRVA